MRVIISGGGTAGHIYPGLALARALQKERQNLEILYVGTSAGLESTLVPQAGIEFRAIEVSGLPRKPSFKAFVSLFSAGRGTLEASNLMRRFNPDVVVGMGAYVSLPIVGAAVLRQIPTVIHEQNAFPGLANRVLGRVVNAIAVSYPGMEAYFPSSKQIEFTGNPIRDEILKVDRSQAMEKLGLDEARKTLLVFGGSRGAQKVNETIIQAYDLWRHNEGLQIVHATGKINYEPVKGAIEKLKSPRDSLIYKLFSYIDSMGEAYAAADLLVCRSGATTVAEMTSRGLPSILVPYPYATDNHQEKNARQLEKLGAAKVILDRDMGAELLNEMVGSLITNESELSKMAEASKRFGRTDAGKALSDLVIKVASRNHKPEIGEQNVGLEQEI